MISFKPRVAVIIPVYGRLVQLTRALESVSRQTYPNLEIFVIDDCSPSPISIKLNSGLIKNLSIIRRDSNGGAGAARNTGIKAVDAELIAFLDSDDFWIPNKLETQVSAFLSEMNFSPKCGGIVSGFFLHTLRRSREIVKQRIPNSISHPKSLVEGCDVSPGSTLLVRKEIFEKVGYFDETLPRFEDWDWLIRASKISQIAVCKKLLSHIYVGPRANFDIVSHSCELIRKRHEAHFENISKVCRRRFLSTLDFEKAVAAWSVGRRIASIKFLIKSIMNFPEGSLKKIHRVFRALVRGLS